MIRPRLEASATIGVNGDGWVCKDRSGFDHSNGNFTAHVVVDNTVPLRAS